MEFSEKRSGSKFFGWRNVVLLTIIGCVAVGFTINCLSLFIVPVCEAFGFSRMEFGIISTVSNVVSFISSLFIGKVYKLLKSGKRFIFFSSICAVLYQLLFAVASGKFVFYAGGVFLGIASCYLTTAGMALFLSKWFVSKKSLAIGIVAAGTGIGGTIGNVVVSALIDGLGWQKAALLLTGIIAVVVIPCSLLLADDPKKYGQTALGADKISAGAPGTTGNQPGREGGYMKNPFVLIGLAGMVFCGYSTYTVLVNQAAMLTDAGATVSIPSIISLTYGICVVAKILLGMLIDKAGVRIGSAVSALCLILAPISMLLSKSPVFAVLYALFFAVGQTVLTVPLAATVDLVVGRENAGSGVGIFAAMMTIGTILASLLSTRLYDISGSYDLSLYIAAAAAVIGLLALQISMKFAPKYQKSRVEAVQ